MGYLLEFYSLDWDALRATFGGGDKALRGRVVREVEPELRRGGTSEAEALLWRKVVDAFLLGRRGQILAGGFRVQPPPETESITRLAALAVAGIIQTVGERLGELEHTSSSGDMFRDEFLAAEAPRLLRTDVSLLPLLDRPFFGLQHESYPAWGGLNRAEIDAILRAAGPDPQIDTEDSDIAGWGSGLLACLQAAQEAGTDIVSLYL